MERRRKPSLLQQADDGCIRLKTGLISKNIKIKGDAASADEEAAATFPAELKKKINKEGKYDPSKDFDCDETGLFWKKMPNRTYIHKSAKQTPGFKAWKDRLTLVLCGNEAGHMIRPGVVYRAKNPRALKKNKKSLPVFWQHNLKAWVTAVLFTEWFHQCFIPEVKEYLEKEGLPLKVLLITDNASGHPHSISIEDENVQVVFCHQTRPHCYGHSTRVLIGVSRPHTLARSSRWFEQPLMPTLTFKSWIAGNPSPLLMQ